jgi:hypothetical protein
MQLDFPFYFKIQNYSTLPPDNGGDKNPMKRELLDSSQADYLQELIAFHGIFATVYIYLY